MTMKELEQVFGPMIHSYTREQAIEDGVLVDVSEWAKEVGVSAPTVFTQHLWSVVDVSGRKGYRGVQDTRGRAHDVLFMAMLCLAAANRRGELANGPHPFTLILTDGRQKYARLWVSFDGDGVTIMFPEDY